MLVIPLQSGSSGNCLYVESGGTRLLFDAGISARQVNERLGAFGRSALEADALFISHDHADHIRCMGVYTRKLRVPLYITNKTYRVARRRMNVGPVADLRHFRAGEAVRVGALTVETYPTPHDAVDGVVFVVDDGHRRVAICTDLGHAFDDMGYIVRTVDGLFLESNYDHDMLLRGNYPERLKKRIHGPGGHISNRDAAELVARHGSSRLQWLCLAHLSEENNTPQYAWRTHREVLGPELPVYLAERYAAVDPLSIEASRGGTLAERVFVNPKTVRSHGTTPAPAASPQVQMTFGFDD